MKKIIPILLFVIIGISHLNIIDTITDLRARYNKQNTQATKGFPVDEQSESEKDAKGKEKVEEREKYYTTADHIITQFHLSDKDKFICFNTRLNAHPYHEDDIQPPRAI